jgi:hypothetical protein
MDQQQMPQTRTSPPLLQHLAAFVAAHARALTSVGLFLGGGLSGYAAAQGRHHHAAYAEASVVSLPRKAPMVEAHAAPAKLKPKAAPKKTAAKAKVSSKKVLARAEKPKTKKAKDAAKSKKKKTAAPKKG